MESNLSLGKPTFALLGGTGPAGQGLALRLLEAGYQVVLGSRDVGRSRAVIDDLRVRYAPRLLDGLAAADNHDAAYAGEIIVLAAAAEATVNQAAEEADVL